MSKTCFHYLKVLLGLVICTGATLTLNAAPARIADSVCDGVQLAQNPYSQNFDSVAVNTANISCWNIINNGTAQCYVYSNPATSNSNYLMFIMMTTTDYSLAVLPAFESPSDSLLLQFKLRNYFGIEGVVVGLVDTSLSLGSFHAVDTVYPTTNDLWETHSYVLPSGGDSLRIALKSINTYYGYAFVDDVTVSKHEPCEPVTRLRPSAIDDTSAQIVWHSNTAAFNVVYDTVTNATQPSALSTSVTVYDTTCRLGGLRAGVRYNIWVQAVCDNGDSSDLACMSLQMPCHPISHSQLPYFENFDSLSSGVYSAMPTCWQKYALPGYSQTSSQPRIDSERSCSQPNALMIAGSGASGYSGYVVLPLFEDSVKTLRLSFKMQRQWSSSQGELLVGVMDLPNDTSTFSLVRRINPLQSDLWQSYELDFSSYTGSGRYVALLNRPGSGNLNPLYIDDITVDRLPVCAQQLRTKSIDSISYDFAMISWTPELSASVDSCFSVSLVDAEGATTVDTSICVSQLSLGGLHANHTYLAIVSNACGLSDTIRFTTHDVPCVQLNPSVCDVSDSSLTVCVGARGGLNILYKKDTDTLWLRSNVSYEERCVVSHLEPGCSYDIKIVQHCEGDTLVALLVGETSCSFYNAHIDSLTSNSAVVEWLTNCPYTYYGIRCIRVDNNAVEAVLSTSEWRVRINDLMPSTVYRVEIKNEEGQSAAWHELISFTTLDELNISAPACRLLSTLSPNPCRQGSDINLYFNNVVSGSVAVYSLDGRRLSEQSIDGRHAVISTRDLARGVYFLRVAVGGTVTVKKFVLH